MRSISIIRITRIATVLQALPGNNVVSGEPGIALGKELMEILADEIEYKYWQMK